jgi:RecJ-like exonuclease
MASNTGTATTTSLGTKCRRCGGKGHIVALNSSCSCCGQLFGPPKNAVGGHCPYCGNALRAAAAEKRELPCPRCHGTGITPLGLVPDERA